MNSLPPLLPCALPGAPDPTAPPDASGCGALGLGFSLSAISAPQTEIIYFSRKDTGHMVPWKSWPKGLALAFAWPHERQWGLLPSPVSADGFQGIFSSKPCDEGEDLLLWECWACQIWNELGLSTVNINNTNPVLGGLLIALGPPNFSRSCSLTCPQGTPWGSYLFKDLFSLLD